LDMPVDAVPPIRRRGSRQPEILVPACMCEMPR